MKTLRFKSVIVLAALLIISGFSTESVLAQGRGGRGGGGGGGSRGGGGGSAHMSSGGGSRGGGGGSARISNGGGSRGAASAFGGQRGNTSAFSGGRGGRGSLAIRGGSSFRGGNRGFGGPGRGYAGRGRSGFYGGSRFGVHGYYGHGFGRPYYGYYNYYRPYLGFSLSVLPFGYYPFFYGDAQYYYSSGLYYRQYDNEYKVVVPPVGAEVPSVPEEAEEVTINGQTYYEYKGVYYSPVEKADGKTAYIISGKDGVLNTDNGDVNAGSGARLGDIVDQLPENTREVTVRGEKLYVSEDGVYYEAVQDGDKVTYKVVGI
ncbi:MAG: DUF6515 family protein [Pedobacter sp.]|uniref:DUF6515 family protein n=1 Tax=Pedobacter sp. TaxID=1411316 RepID=UPI0033998266